MNFLEFEVDVFLATEEHIVLKDFMLKRTDVK